MTSQQNDMPYQYSGAGVELQPRGIPVRKEGNRITDDRCRQTEVQAVDGQAGHISNHLSSTSFFVSTKPPACNL